MSTRRASDNRIRTLRRRLAAWAALALAAVIAALTGAAIVQERSVVTALERANGESLLAHLAGMPELREDSGEARRLVAMLASTLGPNVSLSLSDAGSRRGATVLASRPVDLADGRFELRFALEPGFLERLARRSAVVHGIQGIVALAISLGALEWILRAKLARPLAHVAHRIRSMRRGGGWEPVLPRADAEIAEVVDAVRELGPALHEQVLAWVEAERRTGEARALSGIRARLREPKIRALALLGDLQARDALSPFAKQKVRALVKEVERIAREVEGEEERMFGALSRPEDRTS